MPFECKKYHCQCEAKCCGIVPLPQKVWSDNQAKIQREVKECHKANAIDPDDGKRKNFFLPITEDGYCPFLTKDFDCAIYEQRPKVCKKFGDETHWALRCPMQHADGSPRTRKMLLI